MFIFGCIPAGVCLGAVTGFLAPVIPCGPFGLTLVDAILGGIAGLALTVFSGILVVVTFVLGPLLSWLSCTEMCEAPLEMACPGIMPGLAVAGVTAIPRAALTTVAAAIGGPVGAIASIGVSACMGLGIGAVEGFIPAFFCF